jgi:pimeloyl-ACP methyl ester carboxylesterase
MLFEKIQSVTVCFKSMKNNLILYVAFAFVVIASPTPAVNELSEKHISVNGTTIRYWEQGSGIPVVFVHGAISDHRYWDSQREPVSKHYRFIAIDRRYFGNAPWSDKGERHSESTHVADLAAFIRDLKIAPAFVVGTSGGARIALLLAVQNPEIVRAIFINEPGLPSILTDPADQKAVREGERERTKAEAAAKAGNMEEAAKIFVDFANDNPGTFDALTPSRKAMFVENARTLAIPRPSQIAVTCGQLAQIKIPVAYTTGGLIRPRASIFAKAARHCLPSAQFITIQNARHGAPRENATAFNEALLAFLAKQNK